jgi:signal transduction histidine kinase
MLLIRRLLPVTALVVATALYWAASTTLGDSNAPLAIPFFSYAVAVTRPLRVSAWIIGLAALAMSTVTFYGPGEPDLLVIVLWFLLYGLGWLIGVTRRRSEFRAAELSQTIDHLEATQDEVAAQAIAEERIRIARELHDAVGHAVNVMVLQAGAARLSQQPDKAFAALAEVETLGRNALTDLDHMLGLLDGTAERSPAKGLDDIADMVDELRLAGADITLHDDGALGVERHVQAAAYRITQEALTNALKHAPGARVEVALSTTDDHLRITVEEDGSGAHLRTAAGGGRGIAGMTERARLLGGHLAAGPVPGGGFAVRASLPLSGGSPA